MILTDIQIIDNQHLYDTDTTLITKNNVFFVRRSKYSSRSELASYYI